MGLNEIKQTHGEAISAMANDLAGSLPLSKPQLKAAFTDDEVKDLHKLIDEINKETEYNNKIAKLVQNAGVAFGLLKKLGVAI